MKYLRSINEISDFATFFFDTDGDAHWYMIPVSLKERWDELLNNPQTDENDDFINFEFGEYRVGGGISNISFKNPQNIK